jgi:chemotaxis response regulator CheB
MEHDLRLSPYVLQGIVRGMFQAVGEAVENLATMIVTTGMGKDGVSRGPGARRQRKEAIVT